MIPYWLISAGFLCTALNIQINGLGILLPTFIGYALIAAASWVLRYDQRLFGYVCWPAGIMAALTFPELFQGNLDSSIDVYYAWIYWPATVLDLAIFVLLGIGLWKEAQVRDESFLRIMVIGAAVALVCAWTAWFTYPVTDNTSLILSFYMYSAPAFYFTAMYGAAAKLFSSSSFWMHY